MIVVSLQEGESITYSMLTWVVLIIRIPIFLQVEMAQFFQCQT